MGWLERAACRDSYDHRFLTHSFDDTVAVIREFCNRCNVKAECAEYGADMRAGIYGGVPKHFLGHNQKVRREMFGGKGVVWNPSTRYP